MCPRNPKSECLRSVVTSQTFVMRSRDFVVTSRGCGSVDSVRIGEKEVEPSDIAICRSALTWPGMQTN